MNIITKNNRIRSVVNKNTNYILLLLTFIAAIIVAWAIVSENWIYLAIVFSPFLLFLSIKKPFIFPFGLYAFLVPLDSVLTIANVETGPTATRYLGLLTIFIILIKGSVEKKFIKPSVPTIVFVLFVMYAFSSILWATDQETVWFRIPNAGSLLFLYVIVTSYKVQKSEYEILKWCILAGGFLAAIFVIYNYSHIKEIAISAESARGTIEFGERRSELNHFSFSLFLPVSIGIERLFKQKSKILKGIICVTLFSMLLSIILEGSRGGLIGIAIIFFVYILSIKRKLGFGTISIILGIGLSYFVSDFIIERWQRGIETGGSARLPIWYVGLHALSKYWPIGVGLNNFGFAFTEFADHAYDNTGTFRAPHNIYLAHFVDLGIVGFSLMLLGIWKHYQAIQSQPAQYKIDSIMLKSTFWAMLVASCFLDTFWRKPIWLLWMMILMQKSVSGEER